MSKKACFLCFALFFYYSLLKSQPKTGHPLQVLLPGFFANNMVLQRDKPIRFWGTAFPGAKFSMSFSGKLKGVQADANGKWKTVFKELKAGGPYTLKIIADSTWSYENILIGDVWIASGQSNMEFSLGNTDSVALDMQENPSIRVFTTPTGISNYPQDDMRTSDWQLCTKANMPSFSAVAYYFAQKLNRETGIPIGILQTYWGGTGIKAWISEKGIARLPEYASQLDSFLKRRNRSDAIDSINIRNSFIAGSNNRKIAAADKGYRERWQEGKIQGAQWDRILLPGGWKDGRYKDFDGVLWFARDIDLPPVVKDIRCLIQYGRTLGLTELYINGKKAGNGNYFRSDNRYYLQPGILQPGKNQLVIRLVEKDPNASFSAKPEEMCIASVDDRHPFQISIGGSWLIAPTLTNKEIDRLSDTMQPVPPNTTVSSIYNVKINPLTPLAIKGFLWYQGENDVAVAAFYKTVFRQLIQDWRSCFGQGDLPFVFAQLPAFGKLTQRSEENSQWAEMRESQAGALQLPATAMAITLDLGDPADIHPHNKKPVGERMANAALELVYQKRQLALSPILDSFRINGQEVYLYFRHAAGGLSAKGDSILRGFAIAGPDQEFLPAHASITGKNEVIVRQDSIARPLSVRYAWASSPVTANLTNSEGFPAAPFRTDDWPLTTAGKVDDR